MNKAFFSYLKSRAELVLPFALSVVLSLSLFSVYVNKLLLTGWTAAIIGVCLCIFALCEFTNKHHFAGGIILAVVIVAAFSLFSRFTSGSDYGDTFRQWFLTGADNIQTKLDYLLALLVSFVPFLSVVVYYFSTVLYRMSFLTLASSIPFAVYVKVLEEIDNMYICLIAMLNIGIFLIASRKQKNENTVVSGQKASLLSAALFIFVLLTVSSVIPKEEDARYYDRFEQLFMDSNHKIRLSPEYSLFSEYSGNANSFSDYSNKTMYTLYGEKMPYFKRQTFDLYDAENHRWYANKDYGEIFTTAEEWSEYRSKLSLSELKKAIDEAAGYESSFAEKYGLTVFTSYGDFEDKLSEIFVQPEGFSAIYFISPARGVSVSVPDVYVTRNGVFRNENLLHNENTGFKITGFNEFESRYRWFEYGGANFDNDTCERMLEELCGILSENNSSYYDCAEAFLRQHREAMDYLESTRDNSEIISDRIAELAHQITEGMTYDWEKANALQNYFINNDYVYDLRYTQNNSDSEKFLFESKRGSCSDYASAYMLMARSLGLTARYCEGFVPDITSREGIYLIKDSGSHAYPEVYIQNMGWVVFEPTVPSDYMELGADDAANRIQLKIDYNLVTAACMCAGILLLVSLGAVVFMPVIDEKLFIGRVMKADSSTAIIMLYSRLCKKKLSKLIKNAHTFTPYELAKKLYDLTGIDMSGSVFVLEGIAYDNENADENARTEALECYDRICEAIKEKEKTGRKVGRKSERK